MRTSTISGGLERLRRSRRTASLLADIEPAEPFKVVLKHVPPTGNKASWIDDSIITDGTTKMVNRQSVKNKNGVRSTTIETVLVTDAKFAIVIRRQAIKGKPKLPRAIKVFAITGYNEDHFVDQLNHYVDLS